MNLSATPRPRTLMLVGGDEWRSGAEAADSWWLGRASAPTVTVLTSAAQDHPGRAVEWARRYFEKLGAKVRPCLIQTASDAADPGRLEELRASHGIYLCGGDPGAARQILSGSSVEAVLRELFRAGVPIAGSSAGAMVLAGSCLVPSDGMVVRPGIGLLPGALVLPHWNSAGRSWRRRAAELASELELIAIDERTGLCWDGARWEVRGAGSARVVGPAGELGLGGGRPSPPLE
jgi:cyanophycinase-like exopeptidase